MSGHLKVDVYDGAWVTINIGILNYNFDLFRAEICFKGQIEYELNILKVNVPKCSTGSTILGLPKSAIDFIVPYFIVPYNTISCLTIGNLNMFPRDILAYMVPSENSYLLISYYFLEVRTHAYSKAGSVVCLTINAQT